MADARAMVECITHQKDIRDWKRRINEMVSWADLMRPIETETVKLDESNPRHTKRQNVSRLSGNEYLEALLKSDYKQRIIWDLENVTYKGEEHLVIVGLVDNSPGVLKQGQGLLSTSADIIFIRDRDMQLSLYWKISGVPVPGIRPSEFTLQQVTDTSTGKLVSWKDIQDVRALVEQSVPFWMRNELVE